MNFYIFGLGAIGSNLLLRLAQQYPKARFVGFDFDKVEQRNIGTQAYFLQHIGMYKALAMQSVLSTKLRKFNYKYYTEKVEEDKDFIKQSGRKQDSLIVDCFDNIRSREILHKYFSNDCLHIGFSPEFTAEICWGKDYKVPGEMNPNSPDICTLERAGAFINFVVNLSALAIDQYVEKNVQQNFIVNGTTILKS